MTNIDAAVQRLLPGFFAAWPLNQLDRELQTKVATLLRLRTFQPGELIYSPRELPSDVHYIARGRVRMQGPVSHQSPTLAIVGQGALVGWDSLLRRIPTGSMRAVNPLKSTLSEAEGDSAREILTLAMSADEFESLALKYLMPVLMQKITVLELFDTLSRCLSNMPERPSHVNLKEMVQYIDQEQLATVCHWQPSQPEIELSPDYVWLLSGGEFLNLPVGTPIKQLDQLQQSRPSRFPIRLLGIDRACMASTFLSREIPATTLPNFEAITQIAPLDSPTATSPAPPVEMPKSYPIWKSVSADPVEDVVACFGMICDRFQIPYRPDSLRRSLKRKTISQFDSFELYGRIARAIGLNAQVVRFTPTSGGLNRLPTPALVPCGDIFAVLHDVTPTVAILGSPRTGLLRLSPNQVLSHLSPDDSENSDTYRAIVLERLPETPRKRFGLSWFLPMLVKQRSILIQVLLASIVIQLLGVANPLLVQQVIDNVIVSSNSGAMTIFGILMIAFALLEGVLTILRTYQLISTTNRVDLHLGVAIVRHLLHLPLNFFEQRPVGELASRMHELENIRQFLTDTAIMTVMDVVFSVFYIGVMWLYSARLTLCVLGTVPIVIISMLIMSTVQRKLIRLKADQGAKVQSYLVEILGGISSVKSQHMESLVEATWRDRYVQYLSSGFTTSTVNTIFYSYSQFLNTVSSLLVLWVGADLVLKSELTLGGLIAFRILTGYVTSPLLRLAQLWQRFQETSFSMELLADIADSPAEEELSQEKTFLRLPPIAGHVQFEDISFAFKPGQMQLSHIHLDIAPGTFVGIVGQSGSGKSTLMKLLPRLYMPQLGNIRVDGYDISKVDLNSLRSQIGIVSQDAVLFHGTIRDNIALFSSDLSDEEVIEAAKVAEAHDFIMQLPDGYATQVGERGAHLSGGQRQRIAIARVVIRNPRLLIFDEATSALDYETERHVCINLMRRFQDRTCFFITHRLNTIARADWILFLQSGAIVEQGTHDDLMMRRQLYYCLYTQQSREM
jgi:ATP-binding cassette subfamily B protein